MEMRGLLNTIEFIAHKLNDTIDTFIIYSLIKWKTMPDSTIIQVSPNIINPFAIILT